MQEDSQAYSESRPIIGYIVPQCLSFPRLFNHSWMAESSKQQFIMQYEFYQIQTVFGNFNLLASS